MQKIHLDTDIGGDIDDLCALAMLLMWPGLEITGVTIVSDDKGRRAGYVRYVSSLVGRTAIPCTMSWNVPTRHSSQSPSRVTLQPISFAS